MKNKGQKKKLKSLELKAKIEQAKKNGFISKNYNPDNKKQSQLIERLEEIKRHSNKETKRLTTVLSKVAKVEEHKPVEIRLTPKRNIVNILNAVKNIKVKDSIHLQPILSVGDIHYTLSKNKIAELLKAIREQKDNFLLNRVLEFEEFTKSDGELVRFLTGESIAETINLSFLQRAKTKKVKGAFFPYTHKMNINLSRYQIYKTEQDMKERYEDCCFVHSLKMSKQLTESELTHIKLLVRNNDLPFCKVKGLCSELDFGIRLRRYVNISPKNKSRVEHINKEAKRQIEIGLIENHYFIIDNETPLTSYAIKNYDNVKELKEWNKFYMLNKRSNLKFIDSFDIILNLLEQKDKLLNLIEHDQKLLNSQLFKKYKCDYSNLNYIEKLNTKEIVYKEPRAKDSLIYFADFETDPTGDKHIPIMINLQDNYGIVNTTFKGENLVKNFLDALPNNVLCYFHNLGYDMRFLIPYMTVVEKLIQKSESKCMLLAGKYNKKNIEFKCSLAMVGEGLAKFPKMFGLNSKKEIMPYTLYTIENTKKDKLLISEAVAILDMTGKDSEEFVKNVKDWDLVIDKEYFNHMKYLEIYCCQDVNLTKEGFNIFRGWFKDQLDMNIENYVSLASVADAYLKKEGCYEGCYQISGIVRDFIQKCVIGGRTMCSENKKYHTETVLNDFDAVSLYPSAMIRLGNELGGFIKGKPKILESEQLHYGFLKQTDGYFVKINIFKVNKHRKFPLLNRKNEDGIRQFSNNLIGEHFIDKITLEDLLKFQKIEFNVECGYYYNDGRNNKIGEVMTYLFNKRVELKKENNPAQAIYKLLMNSSYGKSCLKPIDSQVQVLNKARFDSYLKENYTYITYYVAIPDSEKIKVKSSKPILSHFNSCHIGTEILSMSKRIMNEVMCLAEDYEIPIMYQDTDSMHIEDSKIEKLSKCFKDQYKRELIGSSTGQFHSDFDFKSLDNNPVAVESYFLGKKSYIDKIRIKAKDDYGNEYYKYNHHMRMKGIPSSCIDNKVKKEYEGNPMRLYKDLYEGKIIKFNLLDGLGCKFEAKRNYDMSSRDEFIRTVKF